VCSFHVDLPAFAAKKYVDATIPIVDTGLADLPDAGFNAGLLAAAGFVVVGRGVHLQYPASPADRHTPVTANPVHQLALANNRVSHSKHSLGDGPLKLLVPPPPPRTFCSGSLSQLKPNVTLATQIGSIVVAGAPASSKPREKDDD
jgi:hypothetical protein